MAHERFGLSLDALPSGVVRVALPTPFPVGPVNCCLLPEAPVTLVGPWMLWDHTPERIGALCREARRSITDIDQVVVTHGHPDHVECARTRAHHARRAEVMLGVVRELGEPTAYDMGCRLFPDLDGFSPCWASRRSCPFSASRPRRGSRLDRRTSAAAHGGE